MGPVTWDSQNQKLAWTVEKGEQKDGKFVPSSQQKYEISPQDAMMAFQGQQRGFTQQEAAWLKHLLDVLTVYCAESVVWWNDGEGQPASPGQPNGKPPSQQEQPGADRSDPDNQPQPITAPANPQRPIVILPGQLVAQAPAR